VSFTDKLFPDKAGETPPPHMTVFDEYGRRFEIDREEWRTRVLPANLRNSWSNADALFRTIVVALDDGFEGDLAAAAERLYEIDEQPERGACIRAIVLMKNGRPRDAEETLERFIAAHGETGAVLTNLARIQWDEGDQSKAMATLWRGIKLDPNQDNGLLWYAAIHRERGGDAAYAEALQRAAELPGSWRARLWLARRELEQERFDSARAMYEDVLVVAADQPGVLTQVSGDLGERGHAREIVDLILPFYDPERHDITAGVNCLQAFLEMRDWRGGEALLHRMMSLHLPPYRERLLWYSSQFETLKAQPHQREPVDGLRIELMHLEDPVWLLGLMQAQWLLPPALPTSRRVALLALANTTEREAAENNEVIAGREDDIGRLTRAIPLYLADSLRFRTDAEPFTVMPIVPGRAMAVFGGDWDAASAGDTGAEFVISGSLARTSNDYALRLCLWQSGGGEPIETIDVRGAEEDFERTLLDAETRLVNMLTVNHVAIAQERSTLFRQPDGLFRRYLDAYGQAYALGLASNGVLPASMLFGERHMLRWFLDLALAMSGAPIPRIMLIAGLANSRRCGSQTYLELKRESETLLDDAKNDDAIARLMPLFYRVYDMTEEFERSRDAQMMSGGDDYVRWLAGLETAF
jgi:tetratricopeptide (TPR) repeat protein